MKKLAIALGVLIVLAVLGTNYLWTNMDTILKAAIEKYGTAATQSTVRLDTVKLSVAQGEGFLGGLSVANPSGFSSAKALYLGSVTMKIDTRSVSGNEPILIHEITIVKPQIVYEVTAQGDSNLQAIERNTATYAARMTAAADKTSRDTDPAAPAAPAPAATGNKGARKVIIENLYVRDGQIAITTALLGEKGLSAQLPEIHLTNIGKDSGGASAAQVAQQVLGTISASAARVAATDLAKQLTGSLKDAGAAGGKIGDRIQGLFGR
ncbi:MAG: hypothetical protein M3N08_10150 [Pseudomonadota bacterium]|nr:hypothetical protein [Pseudomonadota bacterium]